MKTKVTFRNFVKQLSMFLVKIIAEIIVSRLVWRMWEFILSSIVH